MLVLGQYSGYQVIDLKSISWILGGVTDKCTYNRLTYTSLFQFPRMMTVFTDHQARLTMLEGVRIPLESAETEIKIWSRYFELRRFKLFNSYTIWQIEHVSMLLEQFVNYIVILLSKITTGVGIDRKTAMDLRFCEWCRGRLVNWPEGLYKWCFILMTASSRLILRQRTGGGPW